MRKQILKLAAIGVAMGATSFSGAAFAQDEEGAASAFDIVGGVAVVSDYRFRGVSLSDKDFAVQPTLTIKHSSGLYLGVWGSNLAANPGDDIEADLYAGFAGGSGPVTYDIGATYYMYPGVSAFNYLELTGKLGTTVGPATLGAQVSYVPSQDNTGNQDNIYLGTNAAIGIPNTPLTLTGSVGYEDGAFGANKVDWSLGVTASKYGFTAGVSYVDTNRFIGGLGDAGVVFSLSYGF